MPNKLTTLVIIALLAVTSSCTRLPSTPPVPDAPTTLSTAEYRLTQSVAIIIEANKGATTIVITLNAHSLIGDPLTNEILNYNLKVARAAKSALAIIDSEKGLAAKSAAVSALLGELPLPDALKFFISTGGTSAALQGAVAAINAVQLAIALAQSFEGSK